MDFNFRLQGGLSQRIQSFAAKKADVLFAQVEDNSREPSLSFDDGRSYIILFCHSCGEDFFVTGRLGKVC
jgi:hypothetical protein